MYPHILQPVQGPEASTKKAEGADESEEMYIEEITSERLKNDLKVATVL